MTDGLLYGFVSLKKKKLAGKSVDYTLGHTGG